MRTARRTCTAWAVRPRWRRRRKRRGTVACVCRRARGRARRGKVVPAHRHGGAPIDPRHGAGSLEHRGVATLAAEVFVFTPPCAAVVPCPAPLPPRAPVAVLAALAASARAPPFASV